MLMIRGPASPAFLVGVKMPQGMAELRQRRVRRQRLVAAHGSAGVHQSSTRPHDMVHEVARAWINEQLTLAENEAELLGEAADAGLPRRAAILQAAVANPAAGLVGQQASIRGKAKPLRWILQAHPFHGNTVAAKNMQGVFEMRGSRPRGEMQPHSQVLAANLRLEESSRPSAWVARRPAA